MSNDTTTTTYVPPERPRDRDTGLRTPLRLLVVLLSLLLVAWCAVTAASLLARGSGSSSGTYDGIRTVELDVGFEAVEIAGSTDATDVSVRRTYNWSFRKPTVSARQDGDVLIITSSCTFQVGIGCTGKVRMTVPSDIDLRLRSSDSSADLRDIDGSVDLHTSDGSVRASNLTGPVTLRTSDGSVTATGLRSTDVEAVTSDGSVHLEFEVAPTNLMTRTSDGSVLVEVPDDDTAYTVSGRSADGSREISVPTDPDSTHRMDVTTSDGSVTVQTRS